MAKQLQDYLDNPALIARALSSSGTAADETLVASFLKSPLLQAYIISAVDAEMERRDKAKP